MTSFSKRIREHRPALIFGSLVLICLVSLASGAEGGPIARSVSSIAATGSRPFLRAMNASQDAVAYISALLIERDALIAENRSLEKTFGVMLRHAAERNEFAAENERFRLMLDFQRERPDFELLPVEVLQHSQGLLTIDRGSVHGMRESMSVLTREGVIGLTVRVDPFTSVVATMQHPDCKIDAMVERTRVRGTVHGSQSDLSRLCELRYVELKHELREGDRLVASPDSVFPTGFPIGTVESVEYDPGSLWKSAAVRPAADPYAADEVMVVLRADTNWGELASLGTIEEPVARVDFVDSMSIQERYAP